MGPAGSKRLLGVFGQRFVLRKIRMVIAPGRD
jgi:hypothetical protein